MTNKKTTKRALLMSALSLLMCVSMLIGSTFAWFTDSVVSGNNIIKSGNLDVELDYKTVKDGKFTADWASVKDRTDIFNPNALWEPGRVEVVYLKVSNLGSLELKYQLGVNVIKETLGKTETGADIKLSDHLVFKVLDLETEPTVPYENREAVKLAAGTEKGLTDYNGKTTALEVGGEDYVALIVYMPETVGNEANYRGTDVPTIELGINLYATQYTAEEDSFDEFYDKNAWVKGFKVYDVNELQGAINAGEANITLMDNIEAAEAVEIPEGATVELDLGGKTISADTSYAFENKGNLTISGEGTISGLGGIRSTAGKLTINGGAYFGASDWNNGTYQHTLKAENTVVEINGGIFDATVNGQTNAMINVSNGTTMTINGGTFKNVSGDLSNFDPYLFHYEGDGKLIINNGDFYGGWRFASNDASTDIYGGTFAITTDGQSFQAGNTHKLTVYGGNFTFGKDATETAVLGRVADGFKAVDNGDGTYTVLPDGMSTVSGYSRLYTDGTNYYVYDAQGLISMRDFWAANWLANNMWGRSYNVMADIDATGYTWNNVWVNVGYNGNEGFVFDGHGKTITGLTINDGLFSGTPNGGDKPDVPGYVKDITFDGVKVTGDHFAGVLWSNVYNDLVVENVNVINSTITGKCNVAALVGGTVIEYPAHDATVKFIGCVVENNVITAEGKDGQDPNGANVYLSRAYGNTTVTFENCVDKGNTVTNKNGLVGGGIYGYTTWANDGFAGTGTCDTFTNWNGISVVTENTNAALSNAISTGASKVVLPAGTYKLPAATKNKTVTISGTKDTAIDVTSGLTYINGSTVTFDGVTIKSKPGTGYNYGFADAKYTVFNNCTIEGSLGLDYSCEFNNCVFNISGNNYNIWTWGAGTATFNGCTFNCDGKAMLVYANALDNGTNHQTVNITDCVFNDNGDDTVTGKAAIEITNTYTPIRTYDVIIKNTTVNGFAHTVPGAGDFNAAYGSVAGSNIGTNVWGNKCELPNTQINVVIDGVDVY